MNEIKEITDSTIWEKFLTEKYSGNYPFFQSWHWKEIQENLGNKTKAIGLYEGNKLVAVCLCVEIKAKRGHYIYLRHGPVLSNWNNEYISELLSYIKQFAKESKAQFIRLSRFPKSVEAQRFFEEQKFFPSALQTIDAEVCWVLDITKSEEEILKNMRKSHRYLIKKSLTMPIKIIKTQDPEMLKKFLPLYKELSLRKHFVAHKGVAEEFKTFAQTDEEVLFLAEYENKIIAGAMIAFVGNTTIYRHSASDDAYKHVPASYLIQWEAIKEAKKRNKKTYNFWGIAPIGAKNHPWIGLTLFKTGFGGDYEFFLPTLDLPLSVGYIKNYIIDFISAKKKR